jgi:hypothetical protein
MKAFKPSMTSSKVQRRGTISISYVHKSSKPPVKIIERFGISTIRICMFSHDTSIDGDHERVTNQESATGEE